MCETVKVLQWKMYEYEKLFNLNAYNCVKCPCRRMKYYTHFNIKSFILKKLGYPHEL